MSEYACEHQINDGDAGVSFINWSPNHPRSLRMFYKTVITISRRLNCPCLPKNVRMVNRLYHEVFGRDLPDSATSLTQNRMVLKNKMDMYLLDAVTEAAIIIHKDEKSERAQSILATFDRVFIVHPQVC